VKNMDTQGSLMNIIRFIYIITAHIVYLYKLPFFHSSGCHDLGVLKRFHPPFD
jgi:hypothetical protein